jgi:exodeoxyribonuclease VIII
MGYKVTFEREDGRGRLVEGIPFDLYCALPGVNVSSLKEMHRSPLHYRHAKLNPRAPSKAMALGTAAHCATLEPDRFAAEFAAWTGGRRAGKEWDAFVAHAESDGLTVITSDEMAAALAIAAAVRACPDAAKYLASGSSEVSMVWDARGFLCRGRVDWLTEVDGCDVLVGLKTTRDCRPREFGRQSANLAYHWQWAFYRDGFEAVTGRAPFMVEIVVESTPPHAVAVYIIGEGVMCQGRDEYTAALDELGECQRVGVWPGPVTGEQELTLPAWAMGEEYEVTISDAE